MENRSFRRLANTILGAVAVAFFFFVFMKPAFAGTVTNPTPATYNREVEISPAQNNNSDIPIDCYMIHANKMDQYMSVEFRNPGRENYWAVIYAGKDESYQKIYDRRIWSGEYDTADLILPATDCLLAFYSYGDSVIRAKYKLNMLTDDYPNSFEQARQISLNRGVDGRLEIADEREVDIFKFNTDGTNSFYSINLAATGDKTILGQFYNGGDETYKVGGRFWVGSGEVGNEIYKLEKNKTYWFKVYHGSNRGNYRLTVNQVKDEAGDSFSLAKKIKLGKNANGAFQAGEDEDFYSVKTGKNKAYWLSIKNRSSEYSMRVTIYSRKDDESSKEQKCNQVYISSGEKREIPIKLKPKHVYYIKLYGGRQNSGYTICLNQSAKTIKKDAPKGFKVTSYYYNIYLSGISNLRYDGVEVYRSYRKNGGYKKIKTIQSNYSSFSFTDYGVPRRKRAYYKLRYYVKDGSTRRYGKWSTVKSGSHRY